MNTNYMVTAQDVVDMLGVSKGHAYKIIRQLNKELEDNGYIVVSGMQITPKWDVCSAEAERLFHSNRYEVPLLLRVNQFPSYLCRSSPGGRYDAYR